MIWIAVILFVIYGIFRKNINKHMYILGLGFLLTEFLFIPANIDQYRLLFYLIVLLLSIGVYLFLHSYTKTTTIYSFFFLTITGIIFAIMSNDLIEMYLGFELASIPLYILLLSEKKINGAIKYFLFSMMASSCLLFGISLFFASVVNYACYFIIASFFIKLAIIPFHTWAPDVYNQAPNIISGFLSGLVKKLPLFLLILLITSFNMNFNKEVLLFFAIISLVFANILALCQENIKKMIAYSAIAHSGYMLLSVSTLSSYGFIAALFHAFSCGIADIILFGFLFMFGGKDKIQSYKGIANKAPIAAFIFSIALLSLGGMPPFAGFTSKLLIFHSLINSSMIIPAIIFAAASVFSFTYYLKLIFTIYDGFGRKMQKDKINLNLIALVFLFLLLFLTGMFPDLII